MLGVFGKVIDRMILDGSGPNEATFGQALNHERSNNCLLKAVNTL